MSFIQDSVNNLYIEAKRKGLTMRDACIMAGIHPTTPSRWRAGVSPRMKEFEKLYEAVKGYKNAR